jgi:glycosyltransferase involved in cell wall biosynthesis
MCYNEEVLMPYFLRHYSQLADKIFVFDNHSTDKTPSIVEANPKTSRIIYGDPNKLYDSDLIRMKNEEYKNSRGSADWVIIVDIDEFIYHPNLIVLLEDYKNAGITLPKVSGYDMVGDNYLNSDRQIYDEVKYGVPASMYCKRAVFNPLIDIKYVVGAHKCYPHGKVVESKSPDIKLLHYRFLCKDFFIKSMEKRVIRLSDENTKRGWGFISLSPEDTIANWASCIYEDQKRNCSKVI